MNSSSSAGAGLAASQAGTAATARSVRLRLSAMMFLEYFVWGVWYVTLATYLGRSLRMSGIQIGMVYTTSAIAAIVSPFFIGMVADRFFAAERVLAVLQLVGGLLLWTASWLQHFWPLYLVLLAYALVFMPTAALTNSMSFHHLADPAVDFPRVRVLGPVGWIMGGLVVGQLGLEASPVPMRIAALAGLGFAAFCLTLPHTPPHDRSSVGADEDDWHPRAARPRLGELLGLDALRLLKDRSFAVFVLGSFLASISIQAYSAFPNLFLNEIGVHAAASKMTLAQCSEVAFTLMLPWFLPRLGVRRLLLIGLSAWATRYLLFAFGDAGTRQPLLLAALALHGACYVFFMLTGQIFVEQRADASIRASAQGFISLVTLGLGYLVGGWVSGGLVDLFVRRDAAGVLSHDWRAIWLVPAGWAAAVTLLFLIAFRPSAEPVDPRMIAAAEAAD